MKSSTLPFALPGSLEPELARVLAYWEGLKRRDATMPFWDDVNLSMLPDLSGRLMLIEVFDKPIRFRIGMAGEEIKSLYGGDLAGKFLDDIEPHGPLRYLSSQSSATVEGRIPTYFRHEAAAGDGYSRILAPMWGDGRIGMLLCACTQK